MGKVYWIAVLVIAAASWKRGMRFSHLARLLVVGLAVGAIATLGVRMILRGQSLLGGALLVVVLSSRWFWSAWSHARRGRGVRSDRPTRS